MPDVLDTGAAAIVVEHPTGDRPARCAAPDLPGPQGPTCCRLLIVRWAADSLSSRADSPLDSAIADTPSPPRPAAVGLP